MDFFTADTHFGHARILELCKRPFASIEEHDERLIELWNRKVEKGDTVYHLGDVGFNKDTLFEKLKRLNGNICLIRGNHDVTVINNLVMSSRFQWVRDIHYLKIKEGNHTYRATLCHYPLRSWHASHYGAWHLYGHAHGTLAPELQSFDVGVDSWNFAPVSWEQVKDTFFRIRVIEQG
jgi:calcineurin-like phosphoesterase family protein